MKTFKVTVGDKIYKVAGAANEQSAIIAVATKANLAIVNLKNALDKTDKFIARELRLRRLKNVAALAKMLERASLKTNIALAKAKPKKDD